MTTRLLTLLLVAAALAAGGCTTLTDYGVMRKESLRNDQGHVIGYKEMLRNERTGEVLAQVSLFTPLYDSAGSVIIQTPGKPWTFYNSSAAQTEMSLATMAT